MPYSYPQMKRRLALIALLCLPFVACSEEAKEQPAKPAAAKVEKVRFKTNKGEFVVELNREKAPITVENFVKYVKKKHYDGTTFHRVISTFMIQGGGMELVKGNLREKATDAPIKNEGRNGLKNVRGSIAMARTSVIDSATSQFFINVKDNPALDYPSNGGYAVFGKVIEGMDTVDKIKAVPTDAGDAPTEPVIIESATLVED